MTLEDALRAEVRSALLSQVDKLRSDVAEIVRSEVRLATRSMIAATSADILSVADAAALFKVAAKTVRAKIRSGQLAAMRADSSRIYRIRRADLDACFSGADGAQSDVSPDQEAARIAAKYR